MPRIRFSSAALLIGVLPAKGARLLCYTIRVIVAAQDAGLDACANRRG